jgi:hypothetical protein
MAWEQHGMCESAFTETFECLVWSTGQQSAWSRFCCVMFTRHLLWECCRNRTVTLYRVCCLYRNVDKHTTLHVHILSESLQNARVNMKEDGYGLWYSHFSHMTYRNYMSSYRAAWCTAVSQEQSTSCWSAWIHFWNEERTGMDLV